MLIDGEIMVATEPGPGLWAVGGNPQTQSPDYASGLVYVTRAQKGTAAVAHTVSAAAKVSLNSIDVGNQIRVPLNTTNGATYLLTWDGYWTDSFSTDAGYLTNHKMFQFSAPKYSGTGSDNRTFLELNIRYDFAAGTPLEPSGYGPSDVAAVAARSYSSFPSGPADWNLSNKISMGPGVTNGNPIAPAVGTFIVKPNRWTRFWLLLDQRANDYDYVSLWAADEEQNPVQIYSRIPMSIPPSTVAETLEGIHKFWWEIDTSTGEMRRDTAHDYVFYSRNFVALKNPGDVTPLLVKPAK
jgi:hypothetical protein